MKKVFIALFIGMVSSICNVFPMDEAPVEPAKIELSPREMRTMVDNAKANIRFELEDGFISDSTQANAKIVAKLCNVTGRPKLAIELTKALESAQKSSNLRINRKNNKPLPASKRLNFDGVDIEETW